MRTSSSTATAGANGSGGGGGGGGGSGVVPGHFLSRSTRGTQPATINHKFGSVKYNRISSSGGVKEEVHESQSNPIPTSASVGCAPCSKSFWFGQGMRWDGPRITCTQRYQATVAIPIFLASPKTETKPITDRFVPMSGFTISSECSTNGGVTPRKMSTLEAPSPIPFVRTQSSVPRQKQLVLSPPSLHISFDVEPDNSRAQQLVSAMPMSQSSDNVRHFHPRYDSVGSSCSSTGRPYSPAAHLRRTAAYRQNRRLFEPSEIAQISAGYMRVNGALQQFRVWTTDLIHLSAMPYFVLFRVSYPVPRKVHPCSPKCYKRSTAKNEKRNANVIKTIASPRL